MVDLFHSSLQLLRRLSSLGRRSLFFSRLKTVFASELEHETFFAVLSLVVQTRDILTVIEVSKRGHHYLFTI